MRIISKFDDYYDPIQRMGFDPSLIYHRRTEKIEINLADVRWHRHTIDKQSTRFRELMNDEYDSNEFDKPSVWHMSHLIQRGFNNIQKTERRLRSLEVEDVYAHIIGFCGRFFVFHELSFLHHEKSYMVYGPDDRFIRALKKDDRRTVIVGEVSDLFLGNEVFLEYDCPIFHIMTTGRYGNKADLVLNPKLDALGFQKIVDPFTAYQELSMFLGSVLVKEQNPDQVSDRSMARAKGFDDWSFRRPPTKKR